MIELRLTQYNSTRTAACWSLILAPTACTDGGSCRPRLNIAKASGNRVALDWSTAALGYQLERTNVLSNPPHPLWVPVPEVPVITAGRFRVTNNIALPPTNNFYQLRK